MVLGNKPELFPRPLPGGKKDEKAQKRPVSSIPGYDPDREVNGYIYDMHEYMQKNVERYMREMACTEKQVKPAPTPFLDEAQDVPGYIGVTDEQDSSPKAATSKAAKGKRGALRLPTK